MPPAQALGCRALMALARSVSDAAHGSLAGISSSAELWGMREGKIPPTFPG